MRRLIEQLEDLVEGADDMKVVRFTRLDDFDKPELFLVKRDGLYYVLRFASGSGLSLDILVQGKSKGTVEREYELAVENVQRGTGVGSGTSLGNRSVGVVTTKMDAEARKHLKAFDHPIFGVDFGSGGREAGDVGPRADDEFYTLLTKQLASWKGTSNGLHVLKHRGWDDFREMVQRAVRKKYGSMFRLYRGLRNGQSDAALKGKAIPASPYSSWTPSKRFAQKFTGKGGVVVSAWFNPKDVVLAPVILPDYDRDPDVLMPLGKDVAGDGAELIIHAPKKKIASVDYEVERRT